MSEHLIVQDEPNQQLIDRESAALLRMSEADAALIRAVAWQIAKDAGLDDWREALPIARGYCGQGTV